MWIIVFVGYQVGTDAFKPMLFFYGKGEVLSFSSIGVNVVNVGSVEVASTIGFAAKCGEYGPRKVRRGVAITINDIMVTFPPSVR